MKFRNSLQKFLVWRIKHLSNRNFILILSFVTGICGGLAAVLLKLAAHYIGHLLTHNFDKVYDSYWYFFFPLIGILLTVAYARLFLKGKTIYGIPNLLNAISRRSGHIEKAQMHSNLSTSAITVGFGGSVGLEAPIVSTGAAIGSNLGRWFHLDYKMRTLLIGCGAAAAIGGIFNSPIAGVIFALEVLLLELAIPAYIPLLLAAVTGTIVSKYLTGGEILFNFALTDPFELREIPYFLLLGIITGLIGVYVTRAAFKIEQSVRNISNVWGRALAGGAILGLLIFFFPALYGEGYEGIQNLLQENIHFFVERSLFFHTIDHEWAIIFIIAVVMFMKVVAAAFTQGAGGNGGIFAPSLFMGAIAGFLTAKVINKLQFLNFELSEKNFLLVGMAGVMSGVQHAPLTAIFLIAEITSGYMLILPLMIVSAISFATYSYFEPHSLYMKKMVLSGFLHPKDKDAAILTLLNLNKLIEKDLVTVNYNDGLREVIQAVSKSKRNIFPVVNDTYQLMGVILLDDVRQIMFNAEMYDKVTVKELMQAPSECVKITDSMETVMRKFDESGDWNLPVVDENKKYVGFLSKSKIFSNYRNLLISYTSNDVSMK